MRRTPHRAAPALRPLERLEDRATPTIRLFATGAGAGGPPRVNVYSLDTATSFHPVASFLAYPAAFRGGVTVAVADLNGDGVQDVVTGAGPGGGPGVEVWDGASLLKGQAVLLRRFFAYDPKFTGGVFVAAANTGYLSGNDFLPAIITGAGAGGGPHVRVFDYQTLAVVRQFYAYDPHFAGGVRVAAGPISGGIETGAGPGGGPHVKVYDVKGALFFQFYAYDPSFSGGVFVTNTSPTAVPGSGNTAPFADTVVSPGPGSPQDVRFFDADNLISMPLYALTPYPGFGGGATVTVTQDNQDFKQFLVTAPGPSGGPDVRLFTFENSNFQPALRFNAYDLSFLGGVYVG